MKERIMIADLSARKGETVSISGWIHVRRDQGKMVFFDFRDASGIVQGVVLPNHTEALEVAKDIRPEYVVRVEGIVNARPERQIVEGQNGDIEIEVTGISVLNTAETPVIEVDNDSIGINEEVRLQNRYIDLRTERMARNMHMRSKVSKLVRDFLFEQNFSEIETPLFTKSTPEGARDFIVPSRLSPGKVYALPQSPQQYKQILMASGVEKYFQFARCMRDEDLRGDRQPEFTQLDMEMSFVTEEDIISLNEELLIHIVKTLYPEKKISQIPFPRISYKDAMEKYGNDRPDLRENKEDENELAFCWVVDFPFFEKTSTSDDPQATGEWTFTHNPFSLSKPEFVNDLQEGTNTENIIAAQYDIALNGFEIGGGSIRAHDPAVLRGILKTLGHSEEKVEDNFGHMLRALASGCPPHGGVAWGFDRLMMILQNEPNIREVIAFPKTGEGKDPLMNAPSEITDEQLDELGLKKK
ncbi:MAG: aspartyl-tRNA synthetase [Flavobacteriaceae bacterium]|jgi:aspartyl-tRNA synthetase